MFNLISYAQNFEDVILWRALGHIEQGRYIDVGAQSPDEHSVSRLFYDKGWRGVHVEPTQHYSTLLRERRADEQVLQAGVSDARGELRFFDITDTGLSTTDEAIAASHREAGFDVHEVRVPAITLDDVIEKGGPGDVHWLKIDVEGAEFQVVAGWQGDRRPWLLVIESTRPLSPEPSHQQWEPLVLQKGYEFAYFDGLNRFYVSNEHPELKAALTCGPNVFDAFVLSPDSTFCAAANAVAAERQAAMHATIHGLHGSVQEMGARTAAIEAERASAIEEAQGLRAQAEALRQELDAQTAEAQVLRGDAAALQHEVSVLSEAMEAYKEDFECARGQTHSERGEVVRRDHELAAERELIQQLLNSKSWRITRPLRTLSGFAQRSRTSPKDVLRETTVGAMRAVLARPLLGRWINQCVKLVPPLHERLRLLASHRGIVAPLPQVAIVTALGQVTNFDGHEDDQRLSARARWIHAQLRAAQSRQEV